MAGGRVRCLTETDDSDENSDGEHTGDADKGNISTFPPAFHPNPAKSGNKTMSILAVIPVKRIVV